MRIHKLNDSFTFYKALTQKVSEKRIITYFTMLEGVNYFSNVISSTLEKKLYSRDYSHFLLFQNINLNIIKENLYEV